MKELNSLYIFLINGNVNRLRALVSGLKTAEAYGLDVKFIWTNEHICRADSENIFNSTFIKDYFISEIEAESQLKIDWRNIPVGISDYISNQLHIRGGKLGEQFYIDKLLINGKELSRVKTFILVSGGSFNFTLNENPQKSEKSVELSMSKYYKRISFSKIIVEEYKSNLERIIKPYIGLHLRYTDLIASAPSKKSIYLKIIEVSKQFKMDKVYVASDSIRNKNKVIKKLTKLGFRVNYQMTPLRSRGEVGANRDAMVDWLTLSSSAYLIHFGSSFGKEAAILGEINNHQTVLTSSKLKFFFFLPIQKSYTVIRKIVNYKKTN